MLRVLGVGRVIMVALEVRGTVFVTLVPLRSLDFMVRRSREIFSFHKPPSGCYLCGQCDSRGPVKR